MENDTVTITYRQLKTLLSLLDDANENLMMLIESRYTMLSESEFAKDRQTLANMQERLKDREKLYGDLHELSMKGIDGQVYLLTYPHE